VQYLRNKKRLVVFLAVALAIAAVFAWRRAGEPKIIVDNQSGQALKSLTVKLDNVKHDLGDIPAGQSRSVDVQIYRDANVELHGTLADGTRIHVTGHHGVEGMPSICPHFIRGIFDAHLHITIGVGGMVSMK
jgi:hypothetical protein